MVRRVARRRDRLEAGDALRDDLEVRFGHRDHLAPQLVELVAVDLARAELEHLRERQVERALLGDVHPQLRVLPHEQARGAGVVEVDVREEQVPQVSHREAALFEAGLQRAEGRRGPAVDEARAVRRLDDVGAQDALHSTVQ